MLLGASVVGSVVNKWQIIFDGFLDEIIFAAGCNVAILVV